MNIWKQLSEIFKKPVHRQKWGESRDLLLEKFRSFQELLSYNNSVLELMADMEAKRSGEFLIDRAYITNSLMAIDEGGRKIVDGLNEISENRYLHLYNRYNDISAGMEALLAKRTAIPFSSYTIPFDEISKEMTAWLGGKNANLGETRNILRITTPDGFAVSAFAFKKFMEHNKILEKVNKTLSELQVDNLEVLNNTSHNLQEQIIKADIPGDLEQEILGASSRLCDRHAKR